MAPRKQLLDLPEKLLGEIILHLTEEALIQLRLTCQKLQRLSFDIFVETYFARMTCCFVDPARLKGILDIASTSTLFEKVENILLTEDLFENKHDKIQLVRNINDHDLDASQRALQSNANRDVVDTLGERTFDGVTYRKILLKVGYGNGKLTRDNTIWQGPELFYYMARLHKLDVENKERLRMARSDQLEEVVADHAC